MELPLLLRQGPLIRESFKLFTDNAREAAGKAAREAVRHWTWFSDKTDSYEAKHEVSSDSEWEDTRYEILEDIRPVLLLTNDIIYSQRYMNGARLTVEDEQAVVKNLLAYHPYYEDKIGCGLESIMVDHHPIFQHSRCLFVIRTDGGWIDFSYQKCLREYIREYFPTTDAERFIRENHIFQHCRLLDQA